MLIIYMYTLVQLSEGISQDTRSQLRVAGREKNTPMI